MSNLQINVEVMLGVSIEDAVIDARTLCQRMNVALVCFGFNGVKMSISQYCVVHRAVEKFHEALSGNGNKFKVVVE